MAITINVLGICVSRDAFGLFDNDGGFQIKKCVTNSSFISMCSPKIADEDIAKENDFSKIRHYYQRCACLDINKKVFDYIEEYDADYLLVDLGAVHRKIYKVKRIDKDKDKVSYTFITHTHALSQYPSYLNDKNIEVVRTFDFNDKYKNVYLKYVVRLAEELKKRYPQKKIIINEVKYGERYIDSEGNIQLFDTTTLVHKNQMLSELYAEFRKHLPDAHYIRFPGTEVFANENHKWGKNYFHFTTDYYEYLLDSIRIITANLKSENEKELLDVLYKKYTELIYNKYTLNGPYWENESQVNKTDISLGESVYVLILSSKNDGLKYKRSCFCKKRDKSSWDKLNLHKKNDLIFATFVPESVGEYDICVKLNDENNIFKKKYFTVTVK